MVRWLRWHCPPDTGFEIRALAVWGRARYLSVTEAPHNTDFHTWMGKKHLCFFQTAETGNRTPNSGVKGSGANHYPRAPAQPIAGGAYCVTNGTKLGAYFKYVLASVLVIKFYFQKCVDHIAILSSANEWINPETMSIRIYRLHWIRITR